jgi:hypothetical protein
VKWYPVVEPVECLPFPSKINSLDWSSFPELAAGVGEVYGSPRGYNGAKAIPYARGLTPCEPAEVFADGDTYDPTRPPQKYDEQGFPLCCLDRFTSSGGLLWGGEAIVNVVPSITPALVCSDPERLPVNTWVTYTMVPTGSMVSNFWITDLPAGTPFRFRKVILSIGGGFGSNGAGSYWANPLGPCFAGGGPGYTSLGLVSSDMTATSPVGTDGTVVPIQYNPTDNGTTYMVRIDV